MSSAIDPIRFWRVRIRAVAITGGCCALLAGIWALRVPVATNEVNALRPTAVPTAESRERISNDQTTVLATGHPELYQRIKLWNPLPVPVDSLAADAATPAPPPPALNIQLIGIIHENGIMHAALYDLDEDRILILRSGQSVRQYTVTSVSANTVELSSASDRRRLQLVEHSS